MLASLRDDGQSLAGAQHDLVSDGICLRICGRCLDGTQWGPLMVGAFSPPAIEGRACLSHLWAADSWVIGPMLLCEGQTMPSRILALGSNLNVKLKSSEFIKGFLWGWNMQ